MSVQEKSVSKVNVASWNVPNNPGMIRNHWFNLKKNVWKSFYKYWYTEIPVTGFLLAWRSREKNGHQNHIDHTLHVLENIAIKNIQNSGSSSVYDIYPSTEI